MISNQEKSQYIEFYKLINNEIKNEEIIPNISDERILGSISTKGWLQIPLSHEQTNEQTRNRDNCKIWFSLVTAFKESINQEKLQLGISYNTQNNIDRFINLMLPFNSKLRESIVEKFHELDERFYLKIYRKIKTKNFAQSPDDYKLDKEYQMSSINNSNIMEILNLIEKISEEAREHVKEAKSKGMYFSDFPNISIEIEIDRNKEEFVKIMKTLVILYMALTKIDSKDYFIRKIKNEIADLESRRPRGESIFDDGATEKDRKILAKIDELKKDMESVLGK